MSGVVEAKATDCADRERVDWQEESFDGQYPAGDGVGWGRIEREDWASDFVGAGCKRGVGGVRREDGIAVVDSVIFMRYEPNETLYWIRKN